jgi:hypothetical protein
MIYFQSLIPVNEVTVKKRGFPESAVISNVSGDTTHKILPSYCWPHPPFTVNIDLNVD